MVAPGEQPCFGSLREQHGTERVFRRGFRELNPRTVHGKQARIGSGSVDDAVDG